MCAALLVSACIAVQTFGAAGEAAHVRLPLGQPAPEILAKTVEGTPVTLASLRGKPVVLQFGSITEPLFRLRVAATERLAGKYGDKVKFVVVYAHESHAADGPNAIQENEQDGFDLADPTSEAERVKLAQQAIDRLAIRHQEVAVDAWSNTSALRYGNSPNMTFVIDATGTLQAGYPWMDPKKVQEAVDALLAGKEVPEEDRGPVHRTGAAAASDFGSVAMEMSGGGAGGKLATVIDQMKLTDQEKAGIMPALSQFLVDARNFRETRTGVIPKGAGAATATTKPGSPEDIEVDLEKLRGSAQKLKEACQSSLPPDEAKQILDALAQGATKRLFD
jgi:Iodothyronine deiodinase